MSVITDLIDENSSCHARIAELEARIVWLECELQVNAAPVSEAKAQGVVMPPSPYMPGSQPTDFTDYELGEIHGRIAMWEEVKRLNAAPVQQVSVPDDLRIGVWSDALKKIAKYAPPVNCTARTELDRVGLIAVHALIAFSAPQFSQPPSHQESNNAAPAAPAADAGHVFYGMDGNHP